MKSLLNVFGRGRSETISAASRIAPVFLLPAVFLFLAANAPEPSAKGNGNTIPFGIAKMIIEFNSTANDVGVQVLLDGEPWQWAEIESPDGQKILDIKPRKSLKKQGLTELFFESSEPSLDDVPLDEFLARFPEGGYEFSGLTIDGLELEGTASYTHVIPAGPEILLPAEGVAVDPENCVIEWVPVTTTIANSTGIEIKGYQVIVEQVEPRRTMLIDLPASVTSLKVPSEFFEQAQTLHKFEVLAIEIGGNQTITEGSFVTQ